MAHILIDGYNLIGTAHNDLEKTRNDLIRKLYEYAKAKGHYVTVVFDGWKDGKKEETKKTIGNLTVIYSKLGQNADTAIRRILSISVKPWIVVSSDREVSGFAEKNDFIAVTSEEFEVKLSPGGFTEVQDNRGLSSDMDKDEEPGFKPSRQRGNPRQLSKKDRKKIQALKKL